LIVFLFEIQRYAIYPGLQKLSDERHGKDRIALRRGCAPSLPKMCAIPDEDGVYLHPGSSRYFADSGKQDAGNNTTALRA
jgi:hypothetical protein